MSSRWMAKVFRNVDGRDAEIAGFALGDGDSGNGPTAAEPTGSVAGDEVMAEAPVNARKAPKEPTASAVPRAQLSFGWLLAVGC